MSARLDGKVILVTGAASGIGAATVALIAERGGTAIATDRAGCDIALDVTNPAHWDTAIEAIVARHGRLDGLVCNAGIAGAGSIVDIDLADFRRFARVNVEGAFSGTQKAVAQMRLQSSPARGSIVAVSSVMASVAALNIAGYAASKAALTNMARAIGVELGRKGDFIRVNVVEPGGVLTPMLLDAMPPGFADDPASTADMPLGQFQTAEDVAETIAFLLSDESDFMTASVSTVDGGWSLA